MGYRYKTPSWLQAPRQRPTTYEVVYDGVRWGHPRGHGDNCYVHETKLVRAKSAARAMHVIRVRSWFRYDGIPWVHGPDFVSCQPVMPGRGRNIHPLAGGI